MQYSIDLITLLSILTFLLSEAIKIFGKDGDRGVHLYEGCNGKLEVIIALHIDTYETKEDKNLNTSWKVLQFYRSVQMV